MDNDKWWWEITPAWQGIFYAIEIREVGRMSALKSAMPLHRQRRHGLFVPAILSAFALAIAIPTGASVADDDLGFSVGAEVLNQTRGTGARIDQSIGLDEDDSGDGGLSQSVDIGSFNAGNGFNNSNAVATAIIQQHAVQIIGAGGVDGNTGN